MILHVLEYRAGIAAIHIHLGGEGESHPVIDGAEFLDVGVVARFLGERIDRRESRAQLSLADLVPHAAFADPRTGG